MGIDAHEASGGAEMEDGAAVILLPNYADEGIDDLCAQDDDGDDGDDDDDDDDDEHVVEKIGRRQTGRSNWVCTYCHKSFVKERQLRGHLRQHSNLINKSASGKARRMRRRLLQKARQQARRAQIDVVLSNEEEEEEDMEEDVAENSKSPETSTLEPEQQKTMTTIDSDDFQCLSVGAVENKFKCNLCPATCYNRSGLGAHMRMHKMSPSGRLTPAQIRNIKRRCGRVFCPHCGKDYSRSDQITRHIKHNCPVLLSRGSVSSEQFQLSKQSHSSSMVIGTDRLSDLYRTNVRLSKGAVSMVPRQSLMPTPLSSSTNRDFLTSDLNRTLILPPSESLCGTGAWSPVDSPATMDSTAADHCFNNSQLPLPTAGGGGGCAGGHNRRKSRKPVKMVDGLPVSLSPSSDQSVAMFSVQPTNENREPQNCTDDVSYQEETASVDDFQFSCNICFMIFKDGRSLGVHNRSVHEVPECGDMLLNKRNTFFNQMRDTRSSEKKCEEVLDDVCSPTHQSHEKHSDEISPNQVLTLRIFNIKDPARISSELQFQKDEQVHDQWRSRSATTTFLQQDETSEFADEAGNSTTEDYPCGLVLDLTEDEHLTDQTASRSDEGELEEGEVQVEKNSSSGGLVNVGISSSKPHSFFCPHCSTECYTKSGLGAHMRIHRKSPQGELTATQLSNLRRRKGRVHCPHCLKDYSRSDQIARHIRHNCPAFDGNTGKLRSTLTASIAPFPVNDRLVLNSAQPSFSSSNESASNNGQDLVEKNRTFSAIFQCDQCSKAFHSADNLEQHRFYFHRIGKSPNSETRIKHGESIGWSGNIMESSTINTTSFVIPATGLKCKDCKRIFASSSGLEAHRRTAHNTTNSC